MWFVSVKPIHRLQVADLLQPRLHDGGCGGFLASDGLQLCNVLVGDLQHLAQVAQLRLLLLDGQLESHVKVGSFGLQHGGPLLQRAEAETGGLFLGGQRLPALAQLSLGFRSGLKAGLKSGVPAKLKL